MTLISSAGSWRPAHISSCLKACAMTLLSSLALCSPSSLLVAQHTLAGRIQKEFKASDIAQLIYFFECVFVYLTAFLTDTHAESLKGHEEWHGCLRGVVAICPLVATSNAGRATHTYTHQFSLSRSLSLTLSLSHAPTQHTCRHAN